MVFSYCKGSYCDILLDARTIIFILLDALTFFLLIAMFCRHVGKDGVWQRKYE